MTREDIVMQKIHDMLPNVPNDFNLENVRNKVRSRADKDGKDRPLDICCKQEIERMQAVLKSLRSTLTDLALAIDGTIVMNDLLFNAMNSLYDGRIPSHWLRISWPGETLKDWFDQVKLRYDQYTKWIDTGRVDAFWLGGLFNPGGFLTSLRQETCRNEKWALDQTFLESEVQLPNRTAAQVADKEKDAAKGAIYIRGLWLEGARWGRSAQSNNNMGVSYGLTELQTSTGQAKKGGKLVTDLRVEMPLVKMWPMKKDKQNKEAVFRVDSDIYTCPVYTNSIRTDLNYVFELPLRTLDSRSKAKHWVLRGVCITTI
jgi:dynein heavy chain